MGACPQPMHSVLRDRAGGCPAGPPQDPLRPQGRWGGSAWGGCCPTLTSLPSRPCAMALSQLGPSPVGVSSPCIIRIRGRRVLQGGEARALTPEGKQAPRPHLRRVWPEAGLQVSHPRPPPAGPAHPPGAAPASPGQWPCAQGPLSRPKAGLTRAVYSALSQLRFRPARRMGRVGFEAT